MEFDYPEGATPLSPDHAADLIPTHITTREELNIWEQENIYEAMEWLNKTKPKDILNEAFTKKLHNRMFGNVWRWAGRFRLEELRDTNIGVPCYRIPQDLHNLFEDAKVWIEKESYAADEIGARFHHRLVSIHPFANGNGRHARLMGDLLNENVLRQPRYTWGGADLSGAGSLRDTYIQALRAADELDYAPLLRFARS
jgi:Fic-DOC domain mobile mystery protein B